MSKPELVVVIEKKLGGIASMNISILNNALFREQFNVRFILVAYAQDHKNENLFELFIDADQVVNFEYSKFDNRYYVLKHLSRLIGDTDGIVICNSQLELHALSCFPIKKKVIQLVHDFYSIKLFIQYSSTIDFYLTHSQFWKNVLQSAGIEIESCQAIKHGVQQNSSFDMPKNEHLVLAFVGRWSDEKGVLSLYEIDTILKSRCIDVSWIIIGNGVLEKDLQLQWAASTNVKFHSPSSTEEVYDLLKKADLFIFPTKYEGYGIAILEAMACGLHPIVTDLTGGTAEILDMGGSKIPKGDLYGFANEIEKYSNDRNALINAKLKSLNISKSNYDIKNTAQEYLYAISTFNSVVNPKRRIIKMKKYGSFLDKAIFPNRLVNLLRQSLS